MIWMLCLRFPVKDWSTLPGRLSPCRSHRGQSRSVFLPRPNMLTRQRTPTLWDLLQAVLGACPVFGCICSVYDCLGLQVAERRQMLDLCFSLVKCVSGEPFSCHLAILTRELPAATHFHTFAFRLGFFLSSIGGFTHRHMYALVLIANQRVWAEASCHDTLIERNK